MIEDCDIQLWLIVAPQTPAPSTQERASRCILTHESVVQLRRILHCIQNQPASFAFSFFRASILDNVSSVK